jgi:hypothetical protein
MRRCAYKNTGFVGVNGKGVVAVEVTITLDGKT